MSIITENWWEVCIKHRDKPKAEIISPPLDHSSACDQRDEIEKAAAEGVEVFIQPHMPRVKT